MPAHRSYHSNHAQDYAQRVEDDFEQAVAHAELRARRDKNKKKGKTDAQNVLQMMSERNHRIWWWSWELIGQTTHANDYLSHRAPARASDLVKHQPLLIECRKVGRFACYRVRRENMRLVTEFLNMPRDRAARAVRFDVEDVA